MPTPESSRSTSSSADDVLLRLGPLVPRIAGSMVVAIGATVLLGWATDNATLKSLSPGWIAMRANTALCLSLSGAILIAWTFPSTCDRPVMRLARAVAALVVMALGFLTLVQFATGADLGVDQLLFQQLGPIAGTLPPGRMAPNTSLNFVLLGAAFLLSEWRGRQRKSLVDGLASTPSSSASR